MSKAFAQLLAELREQRGYTQRQLACKMGLSPADIAAWERGEAVPGKGSLVSLAILYDVSIDDFIRASESETGVVELAGWNRASALHDGKPVFEGPRKAFRVSRRTAIIAAVGSVLLGVAGFALTRPSRIMRLMESTTPSDDKASGVIPSIADQTLDVSGVKHVQIEWTGGSLFVASESVGLDGLALPEHSLRVLELPSDGSLSRDQQANLRVDGETLRISNGGGFSCTPPPAKSTSVFLPKDLAGLETVSVKGGESSGEYVIAGITCKALLVELSSGKIIVDGASADNLSLRTEDGSITAKGTFAEKTSLALSSGHAEVTCENLCPQSIEATVGGGTALVTIPRQASFTARVSGRAGNFQSAFDTVEQEPGIYVYGTGITPIEVSLDGGKFVLQKAANE